MSRLGLVAILVVVAGAMAVAALVRSGEGKPAAKATPALLPTTSFNKAEDDRWACRKNAEAANGPDLDPDTNFMAASVALASDEPEIAQAGRDLADASIAAEDNPTAENSRAIHDAQHGLAQACNDVYGDGPW